MEELKQSISIKQWAEEDRPREKLLLKGRQALSEAELIAILIGSGSRNETAVELSKKILLHTGNDLYQLGKLSIQDLIKFNGIGEAKAISIIAALELGRRRKEREVSKRDKITTSIDAFEVIKPMLIDLPNEEFWVLLLNKANVVLKKECISKGGVAATIADAKLIFKSALENLASSIILCHNHPSGNAYPSREDIELTKKLKAAGKLLDIAVLDHIIVAENNYYSFADEGLMI